MSYGIEQHVQLDDMLERQGAGSIGVGPLVWKPVVVKHPSAPVEAVCFVCAPAHPSGLRLHFEPSQHGGMTASWEPGLAWQGFRGVVHGGIVSTVLDEAMAKAVAIFSQKAMTAELRVRFRRPVAPTQRLQIRGWVVEYTKRRLRTEGAIYDAGGQELAHGWATFLPYRSPQVP